MNITHTVIVTHFSSFAETCELIAVALKSVMLFSTFRKLNGLYPNYLTAFVEDRETICGENLGSIEPKGYPAEYWRDDSFPVRDLEKDQERTE